MKQKKQSWMVAAIVLGVLLLDQCSKFYIKTHFCLGEDHALLPWFHICFVENDGMAFGIEWFSKYVLTGFRIVASGFVIYYIYHLIHKQAARTSYIASMAFVLAGALGNIIDCLLYGLIFGPSTGFSVARFLPATGGYAPFMRGKVVDMLYFPLIHSQAGEVLFFRPVFNIADSAITVAVFVIILFFHKDFNKSFDQLTPQKA